jgi:hypothetical protein
MLYFFALFSQAYSSHPNIYYRALFSGEMGMRDFLVIYLPGSSEGIQLPTPASCGYQLIDLSSDKSGRNPLTGEQYKDIIAQKRKLTPRWDILPADLVHLLASAMKSRNTTVDLEYYDLADGQRERRTFTTGDFTCDYLADWSDKKKFVGEINCDFIDDIYKFYYVFPLSSRLCQEKFAIWGLHEMN